MGVKISSRPFVVQLPGTCGESKGTDTLAEIGEEKRIAICEVPGTFVAFRDGETDATRKSAALDAAEATATSPKPLIQPNAVTIGIARRAQLQPRRDGLIRPMCVMSPFWWPATSWGRIGRRANVGRPRS